MPCPLHTATVTDGARRPALAAGERRAGAGARAGQRHRPRRAPLHAPRGAPGQVQRVQRRPAPPLPPRLGGRDSQHDGDGEAAAADSDADEGRCLGALCDRRALARDDLVFAM